MNATEASALRQILSAGCKLSIAYKQPGGAENRRDQIGTFLQTTFGAIEVLSDLSGADALIIAGTAETVKQDLECAFFDAVEAEEGAEPRIDNRQYSTLHVVGGKVYV